MSTHFVEFFFFDNSVIIVSISQKKNVFVHSFGSYEESQRMYLYTYLPSFRKVKE